MFTSNRTDKRSIADVVVATLNSIFRGAPRTVPVDKREQNLTQKRAHIRAVGVREGFIAMRSRSDAMARRLEQLKQHDRRADESSTESAGAKPNEEVIVLSSTEPPPQWSGRSET